MPYLKQVLCISDDCVLEIPAIVGNNLCHQFEVEKAVFPPKLKKKILTTAAIDNKDSFHGVFLFQHPQNETSGEDRNNGRGLANCLNIFGQRLDNLPQWYTDVPPVTLCQKDPILHKIK